jgi:hypothetical protein
MGAHVSEVTSWATAAQFLCMKSFVTSLFVLPHRFLHRDLTQSKSQNPQRITNHPNPSILIVTNGSDPHTTQLNVVLLLPIKQIQTKLHNSMPTPAFPLTVALGTPRC